MKQLLMSTSMMLMVPICAHAQTALADLDRDMVGPRTAILVLGSVHLSEYKDFDRTSLDPVLDRLAAFKPDYITIEALSGEQCDLAARHPGVYGEDFCASTDAAKTATGLDVPSAIVEVNNLLKVWPATPTPAQRRRLAAVFLAAGERASAHVQWLQLPHAEQHPGDGLDESLVEMLHQLGARNNEDYQVAARLRPDSGISACIRSMTTPAARIRFRIARPLERRCRMHGARIDRACSRSLTSRSASSPPRTCYRCTASPMRHGHRR